VRVAADPVAHEVRRQAEAAVDWAALSVRVRSCTACPELVQQRRHVVVGDAPPAARLLLMGEAPGATEDETGRPFVGRSGQLLDRLLADVGVARADVAVLNTAKCRPPGNRPPSSAESRRCRGWTERQLALLDPRVVVPLGLSATRWFLGPTTLAAVRGRVHEAGGWRVLPTYHPSAALRWGPGGEPERLLRADLAQAAAMVAA
jgi:uracil-DNA glycosylase family 4